ncbi:MAG: hypothetical protein OMM_04937 [Candidatus Magnetoglobus multicellularis str. Araruama]|uniref:Fibronectin type-III domain-containing protein n=1 Tax=Candidatus Magnetoglobus multicellularis str. Araruama TaxID=890399 RepID=A0A1V1NZ69_9BACT|nr:MAG: hypothetical protein OMM_04937 [Candidatus Magnetoglobus multicellularis str. Araruama]
MPSMPTGLNAEVNGPNVVLSWTAASDAETISSAGLNYNIYMGSTPGGIDILSPMALPLSSGYRMIPSRGSIQALTATVKDLTDGTYYWGVQAIDTAFAGSEFSTETTFSVGIPEISNITNETININSSISSIAFQITDTGSAPCSINLTITSSNTPLIPNENISYTCNNNQYTLTVTPATNQSGTATINIIAEDNYNLTSSISFDLNVNALPEIASVDDQETLIDLPTSIAFQVTDTEGGDLPLQVMQTNFTLIPFGNISITGDNVTTDGTNYTLSTSPGTPETISLTITPASGLTGTSNINIQVTDNGTTVQKSFGYNVLPIYTVDESIALSGIKFSAVEFGDYDNDGDLDILISGMLDGPAKTRVYKNTGGSFSEDTGINLTDVYQGSASFGDYDNDGDLDILITGQHMSKISEVYQNTGGSFSLDAGITLTEVSNSSSAFFDYDNDGDLDILITGLSDNGKIAKVYQNTNGNFSEDTDITLIGVRDSSSALGDYDNDGDLDILITGNSNSGRIAKVYENRSGNFSEDTGINLIGVSNASTSFGDYDNDGDLDILITGHTGSSIIAKVYNNTGGNFSEATGITTLTGAHSGSSEFFDYNNDGDLDIFISGQSSSGKIAKIYKNTGGNFSEDTGVSLTGVYECSSSFFDYDNDGDLDLLITGDSGNGKIARVYQNNINTPNASPSEPENLSASVTGPDVLLSWSVGSDAETQSSALSYNLQIGSTPGASDILAPMALPLSNGYRQIVGRGFIQTLTTTVHFDTTGTYYWRIQTIDTGFTGSSFSDEYSFTISDLPPQLTNNGLITSSSYYQYASEITLNWDVASDAISLSSNLEYRIYSSTTSYQDNISDWEQFSTAVSTWMPDTNTYTISNLTKSHNFVVIVKDESGNKAIYDPIQMKNIVSYD